MEDKREYLFSSESVTEGHPDKLADQISDAILDAVLVDDPYSRVACETLTTTGLVVVSGEITTETYVDIPKVVRQVVKDVGYTKATYGFDYETCAVITTIHEQSEDISKGVSQAYEVRTDANEDLYFYVSGGLLEVQPYVVTVLADTALRAKDLDEAAALKAKERAEDALKNRQANIDYAKAQAELAEAVAQLRAIKRLREKTR